MTSGHDSAAEAVVLPDVAHLASMTEAHVLEVHRELVAVRRRVDALMVTVTAEIARRSDRSLGQSGLAARLGAGSVEQALQVLSGSTRAEATALTRVATAMSSEWLHPVAASLAEGEVSVAGAAAVVAGLGTPSEEVPAEELTRAADALMHAAPEATPEALARAARQAREHLELDRIADLEEHRRARRTLTWHRLPDGMTKLTALLDPESASIITTAIDTVLSPRRGGPRFVDLADRARAEALEVDTRTSDQLAVDAVVDIVQLATRAAGADVDVAQLFGTHAPGVRVHVTAETLITASGAAWIEGSDSLASSETAARHVCTSGILPVLMSATAPIDVGATHRLHTVRQRIALAAHWGGCAWTGCTRPPSMTEVHHVAAFDGTNTTLDNGIPLCRFHHMQLHHRRWRIHRSPAPDGVGEIFWLTPPADHPTSAPPVALIPKNPVSALGTARASESPRRVAASAAAHV